MRMWLLVGAWSLLSCGVFVEQNPAYCDDLTPCPDASRRCGPHHTCEPNVAAGPPPTVSSVSPASVRTNDGATMTLTGTNFRDGMTVVINGTVQVTPSALSATSLTFTLPPIPGLCGAVPVTILDETGQPGTGHADLRVRYGNLRLQAVGAPSAVSGANAVTMGDLDGDGSSDLLLAYSTGAPLSVWRGDGRMGLVGTSSPFGTAGVTYSEELIADIDLDGKPDVLARNDSRIDIFQGAAGGFQPRSPLIETVTGFALAELNGLPGLDLAVAAPGPPSNAVSYHGFSSGSFYGPSTAVGGLAAMPGAVVAADLDNDQLTDVVAASRGNSSVAYFFAQSPSGFIAKFLPVGGDPLLLAATDVEPDNKLELVIVTTTASGGQLLLARLQGDVYNTLPIADIAANPARLFLADFDCDGRDDIALYHSGANFFNVYPNNGANGFETPPRPVQLQNVPTALTIGKFDNLVDPKPDAVLIVPGATSNAMVLLRNVSD